jgi:hypothetical protein
MSPATPTGSIQVKVSRSGIGIVAPSILSGQPAK